MKIVQIPNHINANGHKEPDERHNRRLQEVATNWLEKNPTQLISAIIFTSSRLFPNLLQEIINKINGRYNIANKTKLSVQQTSVVVLYVELAERQYRRLGKMHLFYTGK